MDSLTTARGPWVIARAADKLAARGRLPGAYGYDLAAQSLRVARAAGVAPADLLAPAMPGSWMVNSRVTSPVFQRGLPPPLGGVWAELVGLLDGGPEAWLAHGERERAAVTRAVATVAVEGHGVAAVSKVLALVCPETVPLMDDAALWFALDAVPRPATADAPVGGPRWFVPMVDWFARAVLDGYDDLVVLARGYTLAPLDAAQVLDRLVWFESWGWRLQHGGPTAAARWTWVRDGHREAIVEVPGAPPGGVPQGSVVGDVVDLGGIADEGWIAAARVALGVL